MVAVAVGVAGCGSSAASTSSSSSSASSSSSSASSSTSSAEPSSEAISKATFHGTWPFTVVRGTLRCDPPESVYFADPAGRTYGVNGSALDHGAPNVTPIWKKDTSPGGTPRVYLGDVIDAGLKLCGL